VPTHGAIVKLDLDGSALKDAETWTRLAASPCAPEVALARAERVHPFGAAALPKLLRAMPKLDRTAPGGNTFDERPREGAREVPGVRAGARTGHRLHCG